jgi:hypothetical protein
VSNIALPRSLDARPPGSSDAQKPGVFDSLNRLGNLKFPLAGGRAPYQDSAESQPHEGAMAKGQTRAVKEKKKPKADKDKPKQMSAYKASQMQGATGNPYGNPPGKK